MQTIELCGEKVEPVASILRSWGWGGQGVLRREGVRMHIEASCGSLQAGCLSLGSDPEKAAGIIRWLTDWNVLPASSETEVMSLVESSIDRYSFLDLEEKKRELFFQKELLQKHFDDLRVAVRGGKVEACGGLSGDLLFGNFWRDRSALAAILALSIFEAEREGTQKIWCAAYGYDKELVRELHYQGFRLSNRVWSPPHNPEHRMRSWMLKL